MFQILRGCQYQLLWFGIKTFCYMQVAGKKNLHIVFSGLNCLLQVNYKQYFLIRVTDFAKRERLLIVCLQEVTCWIYYTKWIQNGQGRYYEKNSPPSPSLPFFAPPPPPLHCWREKLSFTSSPILSSLIKRAPIKIQIMTGWQGPFSNLNYSLPKLQASQQIDAYHAAYH